jgi:hypothetical protein
LLLNIENIFVPDSIAINGMEVIDQKTTHCKLPYMEMSSFEPC